MCGEIIKAQEEIPALGHTEESIAAVEATCTGTGLTEGTKCSVCGEIIKAQEEIPALGHTEESIAAVEATCTGTGLTEGTKCSVCGEIIKAQEEIPALGHTWSYAVKDNLQHTRTCSVCNGTEDVDHTVNNGSCADCGAQFDLTQNAFVYQKFTLWGLAGVFDVTLPDYEDADLTATMTLDAGTDVWTLDRHQIQNNNTKYAFMLMPSDQSNTGGTGTFTITISSGSTELIRKTYSFNMKSESEVECVEGTAIPASAGTDAQTEPVVINNDIENFDDDISDGQTETFRQGSDDNLLGNWSIAPITIDDINIENFSFNIDAQNFTNEEE